ncbi:MAG: 3'-5' exonuclease [Porphyromonas sp.]|nr:3'-5' exonuclease [Porphyromonas sp.]
MNLSLVRPIVFFDLETTGLDFVNDRIIELSILKVYPDGKEEVITRLINPERHIPEESTAIHGIKDEDVKDAPTFRQIAKSLAQKLIGCDLAGYNSAKFDVPMLGEEFLRAGVDIDLSSFRHIDVQNIFHKMERRTLEAAYKFYCDRDLKDAHSAEADTRATYEVLKAQLDRYEDDLQNDVQFLSEFSRNGRSVDLAGRIVLDDKNVPVINFGKYKGKSVVEVLSSDTGYYGWIMQSDFPLETKRQFTRIKLEMAK